MIELLVVILLIAVLLSLLLPALKHARENARAAVCLSNQRQIITASHAYARDYHDLVPREGHVGEGDNWPVWCVVLRPYLGDETRDDAFEFAIGYHDPARARDAHLVNYVVNGFPFSRAGVDARGSGASRFRRGPVSLASIQFPSTLIYDSDFGDDLDGTLLEQIDNWRSWGDAGIGQFYDVWATEHLTGARLGWKRHFARSAGTGRFDGSAAMLNSDAVLVPAAWDDRLWQLSR
jgi:type II secretory pathway pseudopilin PulG